MADKIKIRRGILADIPILDEGEFGLVTDRNTVYIGTESSGNILVNPVLLASDGYTIDGYLYPAVDNVHGLGTQDKRWASVSVGPGSIHVIAKDSDPNHTTNKEYIIGVDPTTGSLRIFDGDTQNVLMELDSTNGASFPSGGGDGASETGDTELEHFAQHSEAIHQLRAAADGYANVPNINAIGDGYLAFFIGSGRKIAGDNDLFWDRTNSRLGINTSVPQTSLHLIGAAGPSPTSPGPIGSPLLIENDGDTVTTMVSNDTGQVRLLFINGSVATSEIYSDGTALIMYGPSGVGNGSALSLSSTGVGVNTSGTDYHLTIDGVIGLAQQASEPLPTSGWGVLFARNDDNLYFKRGDGTTVNITSLAELDGYAHVPDTSAIGDGYVAFFINGGKQIAGDNDLFWDRDSSRLGINTTPTVDLDVLGRAIVSSDIAPVFIANRTSATTASNLNALHVRHTTSGDMVDGFASNLVFSIRDNAGITNDIVSLEGERTNGSDSTGRFVVAVANGGAPIDRFWVTRDGSTGILTATPASTLGVAGNVSIGATYAPTNAAPSSGALIEGSIGIGTTSVSANTKIATEINTAATTVSNINISNTSTGDAFLRFAVTAGTLAYAIGIDNSDTDKLKIGVAGGITSGVDTGTLVTLTTGGLLGIGTTTPVNRLDVEGGLAVGATYSGTNTAPTNGAIIEGSVGIGTNAVSASTKTEINLTTTGTTTSMLELSNDSTGDAFLRFGLSTVRGFSIGIDNSDADKFKIGTAANASSGVDTGTLVTISTTGQFGIGTTTPVNILDVEGAVAIGATYSGTSTAPVNGAIIEGNVGIGTTVPDQTLHVHKASAGTVNANSGATIVMENSGNNWLHMLTPNTAHSGLLFGGPEDPLAGAVQFNAPPARGGISLVTGPGLSQTPLVASFEGLVGIRTSTPIEALTVAGSVALQELASEEVPVAQDGYGKVYVKDDNVLYYKDGLGSEFNLLIGSGVSATEGADGYIAFFKSSNSIAGDNDLFWDRVNNRLGIGTIAPSTALHVAGTITGIANTINSDGAVFTGDGSGSGVSGIGGNGGTGVTGTGTGTGTGVVGQGGVSDGNGVTGFGSGLGIGVTGFGGSSSGTGISGIGGAGAGAGVMGTGQGSGPGGSFTGGTTGDGILASANVGNFAGNFTGSVTISESVGIGTSNPFAKLHVAGDGYYDGYVMPFTDNVHWLGTPNKRWQSLYLGPASLHIRSAPAETTVERDWSIGISQTEGATLGNLVIAQDEIPRIQIQPADGYIGINGNPAVAGGVGPSRLQIFSSNAGESLFSVRDMINTVGMEIVSNASANIMIRGGGGDNLHIASNSSSTPAITVDATNVVQLPGFVAYISVTNLTDSTASISQVNPFRDAYHAAYVENTNWRHNVDPTNITFSPTTGQFTVGISGVYSVEINAVILSAATAVMDTIAVRLNGATDVWVAQPTVHSSVDPAICPITFYIYLDATNYLELWIDGSLSTNITAENGSTFNMRRIG